jgi:hypothetical protein
VPAGRDLIERSYRVFAKADSCAPDVRFWDPAFQELRAAGAGAMRRMLTGSPSGPGVRAGCYDARGRLASQALWPGVLMPGWTVLEWSRARRGAGAALGQVLAPRGNAG